MLPEIRKVKPLEIFTPQKWQTVLLRNYGIIDNKTIASVLGTDEETIVREAKRLGIEGIKFNPKWKKYGYISIIKNNWHLVTYDQLLELIDMDEATLEYNLKEDDFLAGKLGNFKAHTEAVRYNPLSNDEIEKTEKIARVIKSEFIFDYSKPFEFYLDAPLISTKNELNNNKDFDKIVYGYSLLYGDIFMEGEDIIPDELLIRLQAVGINGIFMQGVLSKLSPYPFVEGLDKGYEIRRQNLNKIIKKCKNYGIGVFLYFNEPRGIAEERLTPETEKLKGRKFGGMWSLCTELQPVKDYLYQAVKDFAMAVPELSGIMTATMSENLTNCFSMPENYCPHCKDKKVHEVVPEVNNIIQRALTDAGVRTRVLANLWCWDENNGWTKEGVRAGIEKLDKKIEVLSVSEMGTIIIDGKEVQVGEYAISKVGPCEETKINLATARNSGHKVMAKVQINNSWEMAITPYIPVFELIIEHMTNLKKLNISGLMLSWTLGGYPTISFDLVNRIFSDNFDYDEWLKERFGDNFKVVKEAVKHFSSGFKNYPHTVDIVYQGIQELGSSNLLYKENTGYNASMVTFAYDDYNAWRGEYTFEEFLGLLDSLLTDWKRGLDLLKDINGNVELSNLKRYAEVIYVNIKSICVQTKYNIARDANDKKTALIMLKEERELTRTLYKLASEDARVGYEASNHYYFTQNNFLEKFINIEHLLLELKTAL